MALPPPFWKGNPGPPPRLRKHDFFFSSCGKTGTPFTQPDYFSLFPHIPTFPHQLPFLPAEIPCNATFSSFGYDRAPPFPLSTYFLPLANPLSPIPSPPHILPPPLLLFFLVSAWDRFFQETVAFFLCEEDDFFRCPFQYSRLTSVLHGLSACRIIPP